MLYQFNWVANTMKRIVARGSEDLFRFARLIIYFQKVQNGGKAERMNELIHYTIICTIWFVRFASSLLLAQFSAILSRWNGGIRNSVEEFRFDIVLVKLTDWIFESFNYWICWSFSLSLWIVEQRLHSGNAKRINELVTKSFNEETTRRRRLNLLNFIYEWLPHSSFTIM